MTQLVFLADIHNQEDSIGQSLENAEAAIAEGSIAVLLEVEEENDYLITKESYDTTLKVIFAEKLNSSDHKLVKNMMEKSDNSVYGFDSAGSAKSVERQKGQRDNICKILEKTDAKDKDSVVIIDGIAHLQYENDDNEWVPLQKTPPNYPNIDSINIKVGFPNGEGINGEQ